MCKRALSRLEATSQSSQNGKPLYFVPLTQRPSKSGQILISLLGHMSITNHITKEKGQAFFGASGCRSLAEYIRSSRNEF